MTNTENTIDIEKPTKTQRAAFRKAKTKATYKENYAEYDDARERGLQRKNWYSESELNFIDNSVKYLGYVGRVDLYIAGIKSLHGNDLTKEEKIAIQQSKIKTMTLANELKKMRGTLSSKTHALAKARVTVDKIGDKIKHIDPIVNQIEESLESIKNVDAKIEALISQIMG